MLPLIYDFWYEAFQAELAAEDPGWAHACKFLNLFQYITFRAAAAGLLAFLISLMIGPRVIRKLISLKVGQPIRTADEVHKLAELHGGKIGTPTMGGVLILAAVVISVLVCGRPLNPFVAVCVCTMVACGLVGLLDDYKKVKQRKSDGLSARAKLFGQLIIALVAACFIYFKPEVSGFGMEAVQIANGEGGFKLGKNPMEIGAVCFPLLKEPLFNLGLLAIPFFVIIIIATSNAVNLTDGLDGLATGCTISSSL
ncbi:MAG: phospho-N-acetylmuramoyl-pentapeptide-transferase, partial [Akkermansiaceae bacterium]|nr:phospho-N-acetylmuramoyl-pentapeptide-transferase [Akkermansiaceae bacterium]